MNCIWITVDSFRQDHISAYYPDGTTDPTGESLQVDTPNINRLAAEGVLFRRLRMEALPTVPARRGIFTGRRVFPFDDIPMPKGMYVNLPGWRPIPQQDVTVAEHLSERDFVSAMIVDVYHLMKPSQNFHRGFHCYQWIRGQEYDRWQSQPLPEGYLEQYIKPGTEMAAQRSRVLNQYLKNQMFRESDDDFQGARTFRTAIQWLERNHTHDPFFLYIDSFDPHEPWEAPQQYIDRYDPDWRGPKLIYGNIYKRDELSAEEHHHLRARYAAECTMIDHWVGKLLSTVERLGLRDNTLIILLSDHGKIIGEYGRYGMPPFDTGRELNEVPFIMRHPSGENAGREYGGWVYNIDVTATMLDLLGAPGKPRTDGIPFWSAVSGDQPIREHAVVGHGQMVSAWKDDWLYLLNIEEGSAALYNLREDPFRETDVADRYPSERDALKAAMEAECQPRESVELGLA